MIFRYYQPNPTAPTPFSVVSSLNDPNFSTSCAGYPGNCAAAWGLRIINSNNILIYGAGLYSFFSNYDTSKFCLPPFTPSENATYTKNTNSTKRVPTVAAPKTVKAIFSVSRAQSQTSTSTPWLPWAPQTWLREMARARLCTVRISMSILL